MAASKRTPELEATVLSRMAQGEPLAQIGRELDFTAEAWRNWCKADPLLDIAHGRARDDGYDAIAASTLEIADDARNDWMQRQEAREGQPEGWTFNAEHVQRSKLRIETRLKLLAKWDPRRYGEKMTLAGDPNAPLNSKVTHDLAGLTPEQLRAIASIQLKEQE